MVCIYLTHIGPALLTTECLCLFSISNVLVKEVQWRSSSCLTCSDCFMDIFLHCITVSPFNTEFKVFDQCLIVTPRETRHWGWGSCKKSPVTRLQLSATFCRPSILYGFLSHSRAGSSVLRPAPAWNMTAILVVLATLYCFGYLLPTSLPLLQSATSEAAKLPLTSSIWTLSGPGGIRGKKEEKEAKNCVVSPSPWLRRRGSAARAPNWWWVTVWLWPMFWCNDPARSSQMRDSCSMQGINLANKISSPHQYLNPGWWSCKK